MVFIGPSSYTDTLCESNMDLSSTEQHVYFLQQKKAEILARKNREKNNGIEPAALLHHANDGSFLERFNKMMQQQQQQGKPKVLKSILKKTGSNSSSNSKSSYDQIPADSNCRNNDSTGKERKRRTPPRQDDSRDSPCRIQRFSSSELAKLISVKRTDNDVPDEIDNKKSTKRKDNEKRKSDESKRKQRSRDSKERTRDHDSKSEIDKNVSKQNINYQPKCEKKTGQSSRKNDSTQDRAQQKKIDNTSKSVNKSRDSRDVTELEEKEKINDLRREKKDILKVPQNKESEPPPKIFKPSKIDHKLKKSDCYKTDNNKNESNKDLEKTIKKQCDEISKEEKYHGENITKNNSCNVNSKPKNDIDENKDKNENIVEKNNKIASNTNIKQETSETEQGKDIKSNDCTSNEPSALQTDIEQSQIEESKEIQNDKDTNINSTDIDNIFESLDSYCEMDYSSSNTPVLCDYDDNHIFYLKEDTNCCGLDLLELIPQIDYKQMVKKSL